MTNNELYWIFMYRLGKLCHINRPNRVTSLSIIWVQRLTCDSNHILSRLKLHSVNNIYSCNNREMFNDPFPSLNVQHPMRKVWLGEVKSFSCVIFNEKVVNKIKLSQSRRCSKFSSFNQPMDDANDGNWNIFAPIAKLESLDEIDQVWCV